METPVTKNTTISDKSSFDRMRRFVFTLNNWTEEEYKAVTSIDCKWMIVGKEQGQEGTKHLQGAVVLGKQLGFKKIKQLPGLTRAHIEVMKGSVAENICYCSKEDKAPFVKGNPPAQGKRSDLKEVVEMIRAGDRLEDLIEKDKGEAIVKFSRGLMTLRSLCRGKRDRSKPPTVIWLRGATGTGKTRVCADISEQLFEGDYWISSGSLRWFDGYDGQRVAILDDLRAKDVSFNFLLRLLDRYPLQVEFKGGFVNWNPEVIFITAPWGPREMWNLRTEEQLDQLSRRVTHLFTAPEDIPRVHDVLRPKDDTMVVPLLQGEASGVRSSESRSPSPKRRKLNTDAADESIPGTDAVATDNATYLLRLLLKSSSEEEEDGEVFSQ